MNDDQTHYVDVQPTSKEYRRGVIAGQKAMLDYLKSNKKKPIGELIKTIEHLLEFTASTLFKGD